MTRSILSLFIGGALASAASEIVTSPDGRVSAEVSVSGTRLSYSIRMGETTVIETSPLGFTLSRTDRGENVTLGEATEESADETFPSRHGVHAEARNHYRGKRIAVTHAPSGVTYVLNVRAYDSGVAFRYELTHAGSKSVTAESTGFVAPEGTQIFSQDGTGVYESIHATSDVGAISNGAAMGPPVTGRLPDGAGYFALTESTPGPDFGCPYLVKASHATNRMFQVTYPRNADNTYGATSTGNLATPWNVVIVGVGLNDLVNSDIVESLAPEPDAELFPDGAATEWARPGYSTWDWMSRFPGGITAANAKLNSFWASQLGWRYNTIDEGWGSWNGGNPWPQVKEVTDYATPLGVKTLLWVRSADLATEAQRTTFFSRLRDNGVSGFKADFFDFNSVSPASKERVRLVESILKEAAAYRLMVNLHGVAKPMGQFRTYPNLLNFESVYGKESFPNATTTVYLPFTRLLAGPADYTPLGLQGNLQGGQSQAFEVATVASMAGPLITIAERPDRVARHGFAPVIRGIPVFWDETRILDGSDIGKTSLMARRTGDAWYVAIMNAGAARTWSIPLDFLTPGTTYQAEIAGDGMSELSYRTVTSATVLEAPTASSGGYVARFSIPRLAKVEELPFVTRFSTGRGSRYAEEGVVLSTEGWASTLLEDRLPDVLWDISSTVEPLEAALDFTDPYEGGASLKVAGELAAANDLKLYEASLPVSATTKLSLSFKRGAAGASGVSVGLAFEDAPGSPVFLDAGAAEAAGWTTRDFSLAAHAGKAIVSISLRFSSGEPVADYEVKIGRLAIHDEPLAATPPPVNARAEGVAITSLDSFDAVLRWERPAGHTGYYSVYQVGLSGERKWLGVTGETSFALTGASRMGEEATAVLQVRAVGANGVVSVPVEVSIPLPPRPSLANPLSGTVIGTTGSFQNLGNTREKVYDGDVTTFFDAPNSDGAWSGIDLGVGKTSRVTALRYFPRDGWAGRMVGGVFQGANQANFSGAVTLHTVTQAPTEGVYALIPITTTQSFRYFRYLSPNGGWGNVAEVGFFGPAAPATPSIRKAQRSETSAIIEWTPLASASAYRVKRATAAGGPYEVVAGDLEETVYLDAGLLRENGYFYVVSALADDVEGADSAEAEAIDGFVAWAAANGYPEGAGFGVDGDGNGRVDGIDYALRSGPAVRRFSTGSVGVTAEIRDDAVLSCSLFGSVDLEEWVEVSGAGEMTASEEEGFMKLTFSDLPVPEGGRMFYRLVFSR